MATWWEITFTGTPTDTDLEHVAGLIREGFTSGQLLEPGHDHDPRLSDDTFSPAADACPSTLVDLPCGCQDVHYACGYIDREHDHVECPGTPVSSDNDRRSS